MEFAKLKFDVGLLAVHRRNLASAAHGFTLNM